MAVEYTDDIDALLHQILHQTGDRHVEMLINLYDDRGNFLGVSRVEETAQMPNVVILEGKPGGHGTRVFLHHAINVYREPSRSAVIDGIGPPVNPPRLGVKLYDESGSYFGKTSLPATPGPPPETLVVNFADGPRYYHKYQQNMYRATRRSVVVAAADIELDSPDILKGAANVAAPIPAHGG